MGINHLSLIVNVVPQGTQTPCERDHLSWFMPIVPVSSCSSSYLLQTEAARSPGISFLPAAVSLPSPSPLIGHGSSCVLTSAGRGVYRPVHLGWEEAQPSEGQVFRQICAKKWGTCQFKQTQPQARAQQGRRLLGGHGSRSP